jgi:hypothetical protein
LFSLSFSSEDSARWANRRRKLLWLCLVPAIMAPGIDPATTTVRGTMLQDITGDRTGIVITGDRIGGTATGGTTAGTGIKNTAGMTRLGLRTEGVFSSPGPKEFGRFHSVARKHSPGFTLGDSPYPNYL